MPNGPIPRSQLITPFSVGGMVVTRDGTSLIAAGLDHWYQYESGEMADTQEFRRQEWRLQQELDVDFFRLPPDYRIPRRGAETPNALLTVPFLRFPRWHFCPRCNRLSERGLEERGRIRCPSCLEEKKRRTLHQVPFVVICDAGHIQDFPFREWAHKRKNVSCARGMWLYSTGGASLAGQTVECECGAKRSLASITVARNQGNYTYLSDQLEEDTDDQYLCQGHMPWLGLGEAAQCGRPLRGSLRSATNVYFSHQRSAIFLPREGQGAGAALLRLLEEPGPYELIRILTGAQQEVPVQLVRNQQYEALQPYSDDEIRAAIAIIVSDSKSDSIGAPTDDAETAFRRPEHDVLRRARDGEDLQIRGTDLSAYEPFIQSTFSRITLVHKLKETRAFTGFTRVFDENRQTLDDRKRMLWRSFSPDSHHWLPAYIVHGEGIYIELKEGTLRVWEARDEIHNRAQSLLRRFRQVQQERGLRDVPLSPRFVLIHTFAHLLMMRLTFDCGYSTSSLRERLYVSADAQHPMAGILIYTAAGDSEGTMGGLVRMGRPGSFEPVVRRALEGAMWCSADPICMEIGARGGQGPDSCNLAACHNCALVPETACEQFNRFLDRALVVGEPHDAGLGYFSDAINLPISG